MAKSRFPYSRADETDMWLYLYEQLRRGVPGASEPKGLRIWKMYAEEKNLERSADSLTSRFRKSMIGRLYDANLPCHKMMFLYLELQIPMSTDVKTALELKYGIKIELKSGGLLKNFKRVERAAPEAPINQAVNSPSTSAPPPPEQAHPVETVSDHNQVGKLPPPSSVNERNAQQLSPEEAANASSVWATPSSIDFTRQIHQIEDESRLEARRAGRNASGNTEGGDDGNDQHSDGDGESSLGSTFRDSSGDDLDPSQRIDPPGNKGPIANNREPELSDVPDTAVQKENDQHAPEPDRSNLSSKQQIKKTEYPVTVSTTSDSCQHSLERLRNVYGLAEPAVDEQFTWRQSEKVSFLTDRWKSKIEEILGSYELLPEYINSMKSAIVAKQEQLLAQSQVEKDYLNSLVELKNQIKKKLDDLVREYRAHRSQQAPRVARNAEEEYGFHMRHSYKQVSVADRLEELNKITSQIRDPIHDAHVIEIVERVELLEDLTAAGAKNKADYTARMAEIGEAVHDRVSQILENAV